MKLPVIASLNCVTATGWTSYANALEQAGAAAIELNIYDLPTDPAISGREVEDQHVEILAAVKTAVGIPVAVKLSPYYSSMGEMALRFDRAGADGLVLFNRFLHPDIDPERLTMTTGFGLSSPADGRLPRAWIAQLAGSARRWPAAVAWRIRGCRGLPAGRRGCGDDHVGLAAAPSEHAWCCSAGLTTGWPGRGSPAWPTPAACWPAPAGPRPPGPGRVRQVAAGRRPRRALR